MQNLNPTNTQVEKNNNSDRYETSIRRLHSILRKLFKYVIRKGLYFWRGQIMSYDNCPNKLRLLLADQIRKKKVLDSLLKKSAPVKAFKFQSKTYLTPQIQKICYYLSEHEKRSNEETERLAQIIYDFKEVLPQILRRQCYGCQKFDKVLVEYLNKQFSNFFTANKFTVDIDDQYDMQKLLQPFEDKIRIKEIQRNQDYKLTITEQELEQIYKQEKDLWFESENYNENNFYVFEYKSKKIITQVQRNNFMLKYRNHLEEYLWHFEVVKTFDRKDIEYRFRPMNITTESLKKQQVERCYKIEGWQQLLASPDRESQQENKQIRRKSKKSLKQSQLNPQTTLKRKTISKQPKQPLQELNKSINKAKVHYKKIETLLKQFPQLQLGIRVNQQNRYQNNQDELLLPFEEDKRQFEYQWRREYQHERFDSYQLERIKSPSMSQSLVELPRQQNNHFFSFNVDKYEQDQFSMFGQIGNNPSNEQIQRFNYFDFEDDQFKL